MELLAVAQRDIAEILLEGLRRLEYRGYDSAGLAVVDSEGHMTRVRRLGKGTDAGSGGRRATVTRWYRDRPYSLGDARRTV